MYSTKIEVNNKVIPIRFGAYVLKCIADDGVKLQELGEKMQDNPADMFPKIIYYGALNASEGRRGENVDINDIYDWLDVIDGGLFGEEASKIIELFTKQMTDSLPKNVPAGESDPAEEDERLTPAEAFAEQHTSFAVGELGLRLDEFYSMAWNEYILKCHAWQRMERNKWEHTRLIAFESKVGSHLDYKTLPKSLNDYLPLDGKQTKTKSIEHQQAMEALRRERAEAKARIEQLKKRATMSFTAVISANIKDFESNLQKAQAQMDAFDKKIGVSVASIGRAVEGVGKKMSILSAGLVVAGGKAFTMAADFQDAIGATDQIFNDASETVNNWAKNLSSDFGIAKEEALKYSNLMGSMLINIGQLTEEQAAKQSAKLIELAGDLTAMYGGTTQDAVRALTGALKGNNTMLDNYGMAVNDALVKQKAFELGLSSGTGELSLQAKQAATLALIWEQTGAAQGQAGREADTASGTMRALSVEIKNLSTEIGEVLLPIITPIVAKIRDFVAALRDLDPKILEWGVKIAGVVAAIGPLLIMIGKVLQILPLIKVAIAALTGPVGLVVAAVAAAAILIIKYWDEIKTFFINVANSVTQAIAKMASNIAGLLERVGLDKMASKLRGFQQTMEDAFIIPKPKVDDLEDSVDEFGNTIDGANTNVNGLTGGLKGLRNQAEETANAFEKLVAGMTAREAVQATTSAIEDLQSRIVKLQTGILPTSNLAGDLTEANKQLSELTAGLDLLTGGREINIDVKFNTQGIEAEANKFFKDGKFTLPEVDTSNLNLSLQKANELVVDYGSIISSGIGDIASAIGNAFAGNWDDLGADLIGAMGNLAQQFGSLLIASGVAAQSLQTLIANPLTAIAAGAALVALGSFATAQAKKMTQNATSLSGGTASYGNVNTGPQLGQSDYRGMYTDNFSGQVTFKIGNNELVGVLEQANKRNNRIG